MKLKEIQLSPRPLMAMAGAIMERMKSMAILTKRGQSLSESLVADFTVLEAKVDAVLAILEAKGADFSELDSYLETAFKASRGNTINMREQFGIDPKGPRGQA